MSDAFRSGPPPPQQVTELKKIAEILTRIELTLQQLPAKIADAVRPRGP